LEEKISVLEKTITGLKASTKNQISTAKLSAEENLGKMKAELREVKQLLSKSESLVKKLNNDKDSISKDLTESEQDIGTMNSTINSLKEAYGKIDQKLKAKDVAFNKLMDERISLVSDLDKLKKTNTELIAQIKDIKVEKENAIMTMKNELDNSKLPYEERINSLKSSLIKAAKNIEEKQNEASKLNNELKEVIKQNAIVKKEKSEIEKELNKARQRMVGASKETASKLLAAKQPLEQKIQSLEGRVASQESIISQKQNQISKLESQKKVISNDLLSSEKDISALSSSINTLKNAFSDNKVKLAEKDRVITGLRDKYDSLFNDFKAVKGDKVVADSRLDKLNDKINELNASMASKIESSTAELKEKLRVSEEEKIKLKNSIKSQVMKTSQPLQEKILSLEKIFKKTKASSSEILESSLSFASTAENSFSLICFFSSLIFLIEFSFIARLSSMFLNF